MAKITLTDIASGFQAAAQTNANMALIEAAFENTLSRDGTTPNNMLASLDMNSQRVLNLPEPLNVNEPARLTDVQAAIAGGAANLITFTPSGSLASNNIQAAIEELDSSLVGVVGNTPFVEIPFKREDDETRLSGIQTHARSTTATYTDAQDGLRKIAAINELRFEKMANGTIGYLHEGPSTNDALHSADLTDAVWVKTLCTALKDAIGLDGAANSCSTLTATGPAATALQTIANSSEARTYSPAIKRKTGTGTVEATIDNGVTWVDITASLSTTSFYRVGITQTIANSVFGFRLGTSGDEIIVDENQNEVLAFASSYIPTTTIAVLRNYDLCSIGASGNLLQGLAAEESTIVLDFDSYGIPASNISDLFRTDGSLRVLRATPTGVLAYVGNSSATAIANDNSLTTRFAVRKQAGIGEIWLNGGMATTRTTTDTNPETIIYLGSFGTTNQLYGHMSNLRIYDRALTDFEMGVL